MHRLLFERRCKITTFDRSDQIFNWEKQNHKMLIMSKLRFKQLGKFGNLSIYPSKQSKNVRKLGVVVPNLLAVVYLNLPRPLGA